LVKTIYGYLYDLWNYPGKTIPRSHFRRVTRRWLKAAGKWEEFKDLLKLCRDIEREVKEVCT